MTKKNIPQSAESTPKTPDWFHADPESNVGVQTMPQARRNKSRLSSAAASTGIDPPDRRTEANRKQTGWLFTSSHVTSTHDLGFFVLLGRPLPHAWDAQVVTPQSRRKRQGRCSRSRMCKELRRMHPIAQGAHRKLKKRLRVRMQSMCFERTSRGLS